MRSDVERRGLPTLGLLLAAACQPDPILFEGEFGRTIAIASGTTADLPRFAFIDEECPGDATAAGGCGDPARPCEWLLIDSLAPLTVIALPSGETEPSFGRECLEIRGAAGLSDEPPTPDALAAAVTRLRLLDLPVLRAPLVTSTWTWQAGTALDGAIEIGGVLGGNALNDGALAIRRTRAGDGTAKLYGELPGSEDELADEGRATFGVQFPGRLLGRELSDRCQVEPGLECTIGGLDPNLRPTSAIEESRMVMDACLATPPCRIHYAKDVAMPFAAGTCTAHPGFDTNLGCASSLDPVAGGREASLLVATSVPGLVLFADSATRMFGPLEALPSCDAPPGEALACRDGEDTLYLPGWPPAGDPATGEAPLLRLRVRSIGLVPGLVESRGIGACERAQNRMDALLGQCTAYTDAVEGQPSIEDATPPYAFPRDADTSASLSVLGEVHWLQDQTEPDPARWIPTRIIPEDHALVLALRRDVAPEALELDGLLGTVLFDDTEVILDYGGEIPGLKASCLDPRSGDCMVAPRCDADGRSACCYGLPLQLLSEFIVTGDNETCCPALSQEELAEIQGDGHCLSTLPP